jgi:hypothetical protein
MTRHKRQKKSYLQLITQYGIHIWAILIIANAVMVYAYQISTHAASKSDSSVRALDISTTPSPSTQVSPSQSVSPAPLVGPGINLQFSVPGIGSGGGVLKPLHPKRSVTVYLYSPDVNSMDPSVKPLYTIQSYATYDSDPYSPTYTSFLNPQIDLGADVKDDNYQIAFKTNQSLRTVIKANPSDLGGQIFGLTAGNMAPTIPEQTVLMGDTIPAPEGNNTIDINDYNAFVTCYGANNTTNPFCKTGNYGDFNDDGVIDGVDYNILLRSLYALAQEGLAVPELTVTPTIPTQIIKPTPRVMPAHPHKRPNVTPIASTKNAKNSGKGGSLIGVILFILFLAAVGVAGFIFRSKILSLIHFSPTGTPSENPAQESNNTEEQTQETDQGNDAQEQSETVQQTQQIEEGQTTTEETTPPLAPKAGDTLEKDCYIKTKGKDEAGTGLWLLLTDDNGAVNAHYAKNDATDGFAKVKGTMKEESGKKFLEISELTMEG